MPFARAPSGALSLIACESQDEQLRSLPRRIFQHLVELPALQDRESLHARVPVSMGEEYAFHLVHVSTHVDLAPGRA